MYSSRGRRRSVACCEGHGQAYLLPRPGCHMNMRHDMRGQDQPYRYSARRQESNMHGLKPELYKYSVQMQSRRAGRRLGLALGPAGTSPSLSFALGLGFGVAALRITDTRLGTRRSQSHAQFANGVLFFYTHLSVSRQSRHSWVLFVGSVLRAMANKKNKKSKFTLGYI
jgi:hypothetical protein